MTVVYTFTELHENHATDKDFPAFPDHCFTVSRLLFIGGKYVWGDLSDPFVLTMDEATDLIIDSFNGDETKLTAKTFRIVEHDGRANLDRTDDALAGFVVGRQIMGDKEVTRVFYDGSDAAEDWINNE